MSVNLIGAIFEIPLPPTEKLLLLTLADCADEGGACYPRAGTLARRCHISERTVKRYLAKLERDGWLAVEKTQSEKDNRVHLSLDKLFVNTVSEP